MKIYYGIDALNEKVNKSIVTVGKFDGVHLGHQELIKKVVNKAEQLSGTSVVITFDRHPQRILHSGDSPEIITPLPEKIALLEKLEVNVLIVIHFDATLANLTHDAFVQNILIHQLDMQAIFIGPDFRFGRNRSGDVEDLKQMGKQYRFETHIVPFVKVNEIRISSTKIRSLIWQKEWEAASHMLGRNATLFT